MRAHKTTIALLLIALLCGFAVSSSAQANAVGKPASDFTLETHDGKRLTLSKLKGRRGAVLVFFATWCPACMAEVPEVKKFVTASKDQNVLVYGVNIQQSKRIVEQFVKDRKVNYRILLDTDGKVATTYGVTGIPTIIGIDANGVVQYRAHALPKDHAALIKTLTAPLPKKKTEVQRDYVKDGVHYISKETLNKWLGEKRKPVVIDVLSPDSYNKAHIKGAINIPFQLLKTRMAKLDKKATIVVYCASYQCHASTQAARQLSTLGFKNVYDYKGGIAEWQAAGLPVEAAK